MKLYKKLLTHAIIISSVISQNAYGVDKPKVVINRLNNAILSVESSLYPHNLDVLKKSFKNLDKESMSRIRQIEYYTEKLQSVNRELDLLLVSKLRSDSTEYNKLLDVLNTLRDVPVSSLKINTLNKIQQIIINTTPSNEVNIKDLSSQISKTHSLSRLENLKSEILGFSDIVILKYFDMEVNDRRRVIDLQNSINSLKSTENLSEVIETIHKIPNGCEGKSDIIKNLSIDFEIIAERYKSPAVLNDTTAETIESKKLDTNTQNPESPLTSEEARSYLELKLRLAEKTPTEVTLSEVTKAYIKYKNISVDSNNEKDVAKIGERITTLTDLVNQKLSMDYVQECESSLTQHSYDKALISITKLKNQTLVTSLKERLNKVSETVNTNEELYKKGKILTDDYMNLVNMGKVDLDTTSISAIIDSLNVKSYKNELEKQLLSIENKLKSNKFLLTIAKTRVAEALTTYKKSDIDVAEKSVNQLKDMAIQAKFLRELDNARIISKQNDILLKSRITLNFVCDEKAVSTTTLYLNNKDNFEKAYDTLSQLYKLVSTKTGRFALRGEIVRLNGCRDSNGSVLDLNRLTNSYSRTYNENIFKDFINDKLIYSYYGLSLGDTVNLTIDVSRCYDKTDLISLTSSMSKAEEDSVKDIVNTEIKQIDSKIILGGIPYIEMMMNTPSINFSTDNLRDVKLNSTVGISVKSNKDYNLSVKAEDDFRVKFKSSSVGINNLGVSADEINYMPLSTSHDVMLCKGEADNSSIHTIAFKMRKLDDVVPGFYSTTLTFKAKQK